MGAPTDGLPRSAFIILMALSDQPRHGLAVIDRVGEITHGKVRIGPGTLYGTLQKLVTAGLVRETDRPPDPSDHDPRRRYYRLTPKGDRELRAEAARMRALVSAAVDHHLLGGL
jgi:DNA-binding PadR family transcriptional regulator